MILDLFFPKHCVGCGEKGVYICHACKTSIRPIQQNQTICPVCEKPAMDGVGHPCCLTRYSLDGLTSVFRYDGVVRKAVKAIKYRFVFDLASALVDCIPQSVVLEKSLTIIPIPLHLSRLRSRGFNQAEVLGKCIAQREHISMQTNVLKRAIKTLSQVELKDREKRLKNMENVFVASPAVKGMRVVLIDDVWTTGATMRSAAKSLKRAGAMWVWGLTMAR